MTDTEQIFALDRMNRAIRSGERWAIQRMQPDGTWDLVENWSGGRRSLFQRLEKLGIVPSREAEAVLEHVPESIGFRDR